MSLLISDIFSMFCIKSIPNGNILINKGTEANYNSSILKDIVIGTVVARYL